MRDRGDVSPPPQPKVESLQGKLKSVPKEGIPQISSPRSHRLARVFHKDEGDKERGQDKGPGAAHEVIYF